MPTKQTNQALTLLERRVATLQQLLDYVSILTNAHVADDQIKGIANMLGVAKTWDGFLPEEFERMRPYLNNADALLNIPHMQIAMPKIEPASRAEVRLTPQFDAKRAIEEPKSSGKPQRFQKKTEPTQEAMGISVALSYLNDESPKLFEYLYKSKVNRTYGFNGTKGLATNFLRTLSEKKQSMSSEMLTTFNQRGLMLYYSHGAGMGDSCLDIELRDNKETHIKMRFVDHTGEIIVIPPMTQDHGMAQNPSFSAKFKSILNERLLFINQINEGNFMKPHLVIKPGNQKLAGEVVADALHQFLLTMKV